MNEHHNYTWQDGFTAGYHDHQQNRSAEYHYRFDPQVDHLVKEPDIFQGSSLIPRDTKGQGGAVDFAMGYIDGYLQSKEDREEFL